MSMPMRSRFCFTGSAIRSKAASRKMIATASIPERAAPKVEDEALNRRGVLVGKLGTLDAPVVACGHVVVAGHPVAAGIFAADVGLARLECFENDFVVTVVVVADRFEIV